MMHVLFIATITSSYIKQKKKKTKKNTMSFLSLFVTKNKMTLMMNKKLPSLFLLCWCKDDGGMVEGDR